MVLLAPRFARNARLQRAANNSPALSTGETSDGVGALQQALIDLGHPMPKSTGGGFLPPDRIFGSETRSAVINFQKKHSLVADGVAGQKTLTRLDEIFRSGDPHYPDRMRDELELLQEMNGPPGSRPFGATTTRKNTGRG